MAAANASASSGGTRRPSTPARTRCDGPVGQSVLITGKPAVMDSGKTALKASRREDRTKIPPAAYSSQNLAVLRWSDTTDAIPSVP